MRDLVRVYFNGGVGDAEPFAPFCGRVEILKIIWRKNDRVRIFHSSEACCSDDQREFLVRIRSYKIAESQDRRSGRSEALLCITALRLRDIISYRNRRCGADVSSCETPDGDDHVIRRDASTLSKNPRRR